jgi:NTE family protein
LIAADLHPDWIAGISIGAINGALIAGNAPEARVEKLRAFWELATAKPRGDWSARWLAGTSDSVREWQNQISAYFALLGGVPGFFAPRFPAPWFYPLGTVEATSFYDTSRLKLTLEQLIDFDRINSGGMRLSVGAVNVKSGNFVYFDTTTHKIGPEHVMASSALPPGFPAVEIEGEYYWDGGLVSNTPLQWIVDSHPRRDTLAFQVDLWNARGELPRSLAEVATRQKEIQYSSRTRAGTDNFKYVQRLRHAMADLFERLPEDLQNSPEAQLLRPAGGRTVYNIVHLIYRARNYEGHSKDYEFSRASMQDHWRAGYDDAIRTLQHPEVLERPANHEGVFTFDLDRDGRE